MMRSRSQVQMMPDRLGMLEQELQQLKGLGCQDRPRGWSMTPDPYRSSAPYSSGMQLPPLALDPSMQAMQHQQMMQPQMQPAFAVFATPGNSVSCSPVPAPSPVPTATSHEHQELLSVHRELLQTMQVHQKKHNDLLVAHAQLMQAHSELLTKVAQAGLGGASSAKRKEAVPNPSLGVVRLDYKYPPASGDIDSPASYGYDVYYRCVPGLTFEVAQAGKFDEATERSFAEAIKYLEQRGVSAITGDCGFMMAFQVLARKIATKPVFMSSMVQCPVIATAFEPEDKILILTANDRSLKPQKDVLLSSCGFNVDEDRFLIKGCQHIEGFDAVAKGEKVPLDVVQPGIMRLALEFIRSHPAIRGILLECTELPPYADALRAATGLPVWDAITGTDFYVSACADNPRFGASDWQAKWDHQQENYAFGQNLIDSDKARLHNEAGPSGSSAPAPKRKPTEAQVQKAAKRLKKQAAPILGVVRLDYNYPPAAGDIDCPGSYNYDVLFRCVPGLTFAMAQSGRMTPAVEAQFRKAVQWLEKRGVCGITGDCGFMMAFQPIAVQECNVPVFLSSMVQSPMISVAFNKYDKVLILTANSETLKPQKDVLLNKCGFDVDDTRFVIYGCQDVPGFDAVDKGEKVDVEYVTPGMVKMVKDIIHRIPVIRAILLECTELPPYADALRRSTRLPVFDAITCADFFVSARRDNPRFGLNEWQAEWDGMITEYNVGDNLNKSDYSLVINKN